jgi:DNA-directed RNA polymerase specialized sigma24 family protein
MTRNPINERAVRNAAGGDELASSALFLALRAQFLGVSKSYFRDNHDFHAAEEALENAFLKTIAHVRGCFTWRSEGRFCAFFKQVLVSACIDAYRHRRHETEWIRDHVLPAYVIDRDGNELERVEEAADAREDDTQSHFGGEKPIQACKALMAFRELRGQDRDLLSAYSDLAEIPGSDQWPSHKRTGYLKARVSLDGNAFYVAHSRFRKRAEGLAAELGVRLR